MINKIFKYKGKKYIVSEVDFKGKTKSVRIKRHGFNGLFINKNLGEADKQRELHRLITMKGLRAVG